MKIPHTFLATGAKVQLVGNAEDQATNALPNTINSIISWIIGILGIVCVIVMIIGGITYMTSSGDAGKVKKAKDTILYGLIGLIVCALAFVIVNFVIGGILNSGSSTPNNNEPNESNGLHIDATSVNSIT